MEETRTIYVQTAKPSRNNRNMPEQGPATWYRLTIPATAKVTFGPLIPGRGESGYDRGLYLRIYKTKDAQLGVIPNVLQFRDDELTFAVPTSNGFEEIGEVELLGNMAEGRLREDHAEQMRGIPDGEND